MQNKNDFFKDKNGNRVLLTGLQCHNSSSSPGMIGETIQAIKKIEGNLLEAPVYWCDLEVRENEYDMSQIKNLIDQARAADIYLIPLWFGFSKNGLSTYAPQYIKTNPSKYELAVTAAGIPVESLSANYQATLERDKQAFLKMVQFIEEYDQVGTVIAIQVENEVGLAGTDRDYSEKAENQFRQGVPRELQDIKMADCGISEKVEGCSDWRGLFGRYGNEAFTAWQFASYIQELAQAAKQILQIPYIMNVSIEINGFEEPGHSYIAGGPISRMLPIYQKIAKDIHLFGPDIYLATDRDFRRACVAYKSEENPLFIPESLQSGIGPALNVITAIGEYDAIGICAFGAESMVYNGEFTEAAEPLAASLKMIASLAPMIIKYRGTGRIHAITQTEFASWQYVKAEQYHIVANFINCHPRPQHYFGSRINLEAPENEKYLNARGRGLIIECGHGEFYIVGAGLCLDFRRRSNIEEEKPYAFLQSNIASQLHFESVEEGYFKGDEWVCEYKRNGDEANYQLYVHQGQIIRLKLNVACMERNMS